MRRLHAIDTGARTAGRRHRPDGSRNFKRWVVPSVVLAECLQGHAGRDANQNRFLKTCDIAEAVPESVARRAALLRRLARRGSAVDALVVASAEPGGTVLTSDPGDLDALAVHAADVTIERV